MDKVLWILGAFLLICSHMVAYHLGVIKACDNIEKALRKEENK